MDRPFRLIAVQKHGHACSVRLLKGVVEDAELEELGSEISRLLDEEGCQNLVLVLGPENPGCMFSVFLAKLLNLKKRLDAVGGRLVLANVHPEALKVLQVVGVEKFFTYYPDEAKALAALS